MPFWVPNGTGYQERAEIHCRQWAKEDALVLGSKWARPVLGKAAVYVAQMPAPGNPSEPEYGR